MFESHSCYVLLLPCDILLASVGAAKRSLLFLAWLRAVFGTILFYIYLSREKYHRPYLQAYKYSPRDLMNCRLAVPGLLFVGWDCNFS